MLVLKLKVPDEINVSSSDFLKNITTGLKRLARDVSSQFQLREKRYSIGGNNTIVNRSGDRTQDSVDEINTSIVENQFEVVLNYTFSDRFFTLLFFFMKIYWRLFL